MSDYFKGKDALLLQEYFDLKVKLSERQVTRTYQERIFNNTVEIDYEIEDIQKNIIEVVSMFDTFQLQQIIYMSLNIDYDDLVTKGIIR